MKANATSIYLELGGGAHGHVDLVLTPAEYVHVSHVLYVCYALLPALVIPVGTTQHDATWCQEEHKEHRHLFKEMIDLEKSLIKHLSHAIPSMYLKPFHNVQSNAITTNIPTIIHHLMTTYGRVPSENVQNEETALCTKFSTSQSLLW